MSFEKQFTNSIEFRTSFDSQFTLSAQACALLESTFRKTNEQAMQEPFFSIRLQVCSLATSYAKQACVDAYAYRCLADSHVFLNACIEQQAIQSKYMTLTIGDVSFQGRKLFNTSRSTLLDAVANGISTQDDPVFHAWLTLADMTVIDFTIVEHLHRAGICHSPEEPGQQLTIWRPERKGLLDYHPILVDDDLLKRLQKPVQ